MALDKDCILVVEDDEQVRAVIATLLAKAGFAVQAAPDGEAGLAHLERERCDLILLDMVMPGMNGWAFIRRLAMLPEPPPVIVLSGKYASPQPLGDLNRYVTGYVSKPFNMVSLVQMCTKAIASRSPRPAVGEERRTAPRRNLFVRATLLSDQGSPLAEGIMTDFSIAGAKVDLGVPLTPGQLAHLRLESLPDIEPVLLEARVVWCDGSTVGLHFIHLSALNEHRLRLLLDPSKGAPEP